MYHFVLNAACGGIIVTKKSQIKKDYFYFLHFFLHVITAL